MLASGVPSPVESGNIEAGTPTTTATTATLRTITLAITTTISSTISTTVTLKISRTVTSDTHPKWKSHAIWMNR